MVAYKYDPFGKFSIVVENILNGTIWNVTKISTLQDIKLISIENKEKVYKCNSGEYISKIFVYNNVADCRDGDDESNITCYLNGTETRGSFCRISCSKPHCTCGSLFYQRIGGGCLPFKSKCALSCFHRIFKHINRYDMFPQGDQTFKNNTNTVPDLMMPFIKTDCTVEEINCNDNTETCFATGCSKSNEIQCIYGCKKCFPFYKLCVYELDLNGDLMHCSSGSHLANCKDMQCNNMFKCFDYYCIPYR